MAETGELGDNRDIIGLQLVEELTALPLVPVPGGTDRLLDPLVDVEALLIRELQDLEAVVLGRLSAA
ncbi:MAG: hypothetical protein NVS2B16_17840 [Chloroflexota bacterium]